MGMYDYIYCHYPLPQPETVDAVIDANTDFQTKDLMSSLEQVRIDEDGTLRHENGDIYAERYRDNPPILIWDVVSFYTSVEVNTNDPEIVRSVWIEYKAFFKDSKLIEVVKLPETESYFKIVEVFQNSNVMGRQYIATDEALARLSDE